MPPVAKTGDHYLVQFPIDITSSAFSKRVDRVDLLGMIHAHPFKFDHAFALEGLVLASAKDGTESL